MLLLSTATYLEFHECGRLSVSWDSEILESVLWWERGALYSAYKAAALPASSRLPAATHMTTDLGSACRLVEGSWGNGWQEREKDSRYQTGPCSPGPHPCGVAMEGGRGGLDLPESLPTFLQTNLSYILLFHLYSILFICVGHISVDFSTRVSYPEVSQVFDWKSL